MREFAARLQLVPYLEGGSSYAGADCWGIVEMWYKEWLGVDLPNRGSISPGPAGIQTGFESVQNFELVEAPSNHCLAIMKTGRLTFGHVGVVWNNGVLHSEKGHGCVWQKLEDRALKSRITCFLGYKRQ